VLGDGFEDGYLLPASNWSPLLKKGVVSGYKYTDRDRVLGPIFMAQIKAGLLKVLGKGAALGHGLGTEPANLTVVFESGDGAYLCLGVGDGSKTAYKAGSRDRDAPSRPPIQSQVEVLALHEPLQQGTPPASHDAPAGRQQYAFPSSGTVMHATPPQHGRVAPPGRMQLAPGGPQQAPSSHVPKGAQSAGSSQPPSKHAPKSPGVSTHTAPGQHGMPSSGEQTVSPHVGQVQSGRQSRGKQVDWSMPSHSSVPSRTLLPQTGSGMGQPSSAEAFTTFHRVALSTFSVPPAAPPSFTQ
jgi:hypothetical protein